MITKYQRYIKSKPVIKLGDHYVMYKYDVPYGDKYIYLYLTFFDKLKAIKIDFDKKDITTNESVSNDQMTLFEAFRDIVLDFKKESKSKFIYFRAKESRENIYDKIVNVFNKGDFTELTFRDDRLKEGKKWYFLIDKKYDTPKYREYIKNTWEKSVEYLVKNGLP